MQRAHGFTIVELLIVIVVIGILAAISIVAYGNISQKANNAATIDVAGKTLKLIQAYVAENGTYPLTGPATQVACVTTQSGCRDSTGAIAAHAVFDGNMSSVGQLPRSVPIQNSERYGIHITYWSGATEGPVYMIYTLKGISTQCGLSGVLNSSMNGYATGGYTNGNLNGLGMTMCAIKVPGPAHSA